MAEVKTTRTRTRPSATKPPATKRTAAKAGARPPAQAAVDVLEPREYPGALTVPVPTIGVRRVHLPAPHVDLAGPRTAVANAAHGAAGVAGAVRDRLPDRNHLLYYGGLGAMAAFGVVSWPVAAALGAGVWVAGRARAASSTPPERKASTSGQAPAAQRRES